MRKKMHEPGGRREKFAPHVHLNVASGETVNRYRLLFPGRGEFGAGGRIFLPAGAAGYNQIALAGSRKGNRFTKCKAGK